MRRLAGALLVALLAQSCSSVSVPVLMHETGDTLGAGRSKLGAEFGSSRLIPIPPTGSAATGIAQDAGIFQSGLLGITGAYGLGPNIDGQLRAYYKLAGAGWRFGTKYKLGQKGNLSYAAMLGYGRHAGKGTISAAADGASTELDQTLSVSSLDFGIPVSYKTGAGSAVYSGISYFHNSSSGASAGNAVSDTSGDLGFNLGYKMGFGRFEVDFQGAYVKVTDPFASSSRFVPYFGVEGGMLF